MTWEATHIANFPGATFWIWARPLTAPADVLVKIPPECHAACGPISMRLLLTSLGLRASQIEFWSVQGTTYLPQEGANPLLDQPLPPPGPWGDPAISVRMRIPTAGAPVYENSSPSAQQAAIPNAAMTTCDPSSERALAAFEADWHALQLLETQLSSVRKQLGAIQGQLQSLNRDLSPDERLAADNQDTRDWQDARRWLRDALANVSRWIRDHDIGMVSAAGNRNRFEDIYERHVVPRRAFEGLPAVCQEFEQHRKTAQHLLVQMQSAHQSAGRDGVNRARQVLSRIAAKVRKSKEQRGSR